MNFEDIAQNNPENRKDLLKHFEKSEVVLMEGFTSVQLQVMKNSIEKAHSEGQLDDTKYGKALEDLKSYVKAEIDGEERWVKSENK